MFLADRLTLDAPRRTKDGYMAVRAKAARTGVYQYDGREIDPDNKHGLRDAGTINVLRDEQTVFDEAAVRSFIGKPITDDHPKDAVTADNWKDHARGVVMGAKWEEGGYLAFDLLLTDAAAIKKVEAGKRELSNGYSTDLEFGDFTGPQGVKCAARQTSIFGNHVAIVDKARAGENCRIADASTCETIPHLMLTDLAAHLLGDGQTYSDSDPNDKNARQRREAVDNGVSQMATEIILVDGLQVEVTDAAKAAITKLQGQLADSNKAKGELETQVAKLTTDNATLTSDKADLEKKLQDAAITPTKLQDAAKAYAHTLDFAKKIAPKATFADEMDEPAIRRTAVSAHLGDAAKDWSDDQITVSFDTLALKAADEKPDPLRTTITNGVKSLGDGKAAVEDRRRLWLDNKESAYRGNPVEA